MAFEKAFSLLKGSVSEESGEKKKRVILFLTDGAPSDGRKELIFHTIRDKNFELNNSVIILTYGFGSAVNPTILEDIAKQNTAKYGAPANTSVGDITVINEVLALGPGVVTCLTRCMTYATCQTGDAENDGLQKIDSYFTFECRSCVDLFRLNMSSRGRYEKLGIAVKFLKIRSTWSFHVVVLQMTGMKCI